MRTASLCIGLALTIGSCFAATVTADVYDLGDKLELFVDRQRIEATANVELRLHEPRAAETVLEFDAPWEGPHSTYVTVFRDGDKVRMYYRGWTAVEDGKDGPQYACYAESADGIRFTKPSLGLIAVNGSTANNVVVGDPAHNFTPFKDARPGVPGEERYKALCDGETEADGRCLFAYVSADGLNWRKLLDEPVLTRQPFRYGFDSQNLAFWDERRGLYVCYYRVFIDKLRTIAVAVSCDFRTWKKLGVLDLSDGPTEHFYTSATTPYFRAPHYYFAFPKRLVPERRVLPDHPREFISDGVFMSSRDGVKFDRTFTEAFIRPGRDQRNWGDRSQRVSWGMLQTSDDEMSIYYSQHYRFATNHLRRGVLRLDGIASAHAGGKAGELVTKPFTFTGKKLTLNFATSAAGSVQVEVQDAGGKPLPGFELENAPELFGDQIAESYKWKAGDDVSSLAGKPVKLRFVIRDADVFSYRFTE